MGPKMLLDLGLKLVDKLIALVKKREEVNRATFDDFIQPAYEAFELVHKDYIESLTRYGARLADTTLPMNLEHPVFGDIELDSLKTGHLRTKLKDLKPKNASAKLVPFLTAIEAYLRGVAVSGERAEFLDRLVVNPNSVATNLDGLGGTEDLDERRAKDADPDDRVHTVLWSVEGPRPGEPPVAFIYSDPLRAGVRDAFAGYDGPLNTTDDETIQEGIQTFFYLSEQDRRRKCSEAVKKAMAHFQASYQHVSSAYASLRSDLLSPS